MSKISKDEKKLCFVCKKQITTKQYYKVCSKVCLVSKLDYDSIIMPKSFIRHINNHSNSHDTLTGILYSFATRHNYNRDLVVKKNAELYLVQIKDI